MAAMTKRLMGDVKEIMSQVFRDSPPVLIAEHEVQRCGAIGPELLALVVGPPETPYAHGFFLFRIAVDQDYPNTCPKVQFLSTDSGKVRLNPNLYANGKVCLSILGTWHGDSWRSSYSLLYLLRCLQSIVLVGDPYFNEPGIDRKSRSNLVMSERYNERTFHESMRVAVLGVMESLLHIPLPTSPSMILPECVNPENAVAQSPVVPETPGLSEAGNDDEFGRMTPEPTQEAPAAALPASTPPLAVSPPVVSGPCIQDFHAPFAPWIKRYCYVWLETYEHLLSRPEVLRLDHTAMAVAPFDSLQRRATGAPAQGFQHENLLERLRNIEKALDDETESWRAEGAAIGAVTHHYFGRILLDALHSFDVDGVMASLENEANPFVWNFLILNPSSARRRQESADTPQAPTDACLRGIYEQSMYRVEAVYCASNPAEPPRLKFAQRIWHPNISPRRGVPFWFCTEAATGDDRFLPRAVAMQLWDLLACPPLSSKTAAVNEEASRMCFSQSESERSAFLRRAWHLAEATLQ